MCIRDRVGFAGIGRSGRLGSAAPDGRGGEGVHTGRLFALAGVVIGIVGLFLKALTSAGEGLLPALHQANPDFPDGIPTIWGGLDTWAQIVLVILIVVVVALALMGVRSAAMSRSSSLVTAVIGVALLAYAVVKY